jgi:hypothetical protein
MKKIPSIKSPLKLDSISSMLRNLWWKMAYLLFITMGGATDLFETGQILYKLDDRLYKNWLDLRTLFFCTVRKSSDIFVYVDILMNIFAMIKAWTVFSTRSVQRALPKCFPIWITDNTRRRAIILKRFISSLSDLIINIFFQYFLIRLTDASTMLCFRSYSIEPDKISLACMWRQSFSSLGRVVGFSPCSAAFTTERRRTYLGLCNVI